MVAMGIPCALLVSLDTLAGNAGSRWVTTWEQAMTSQFEQPKDAGGMLRLDASRQPVFAVPTVRDTTLRMRARVSLGGSQARIRLSNVFGRQPLTIAAAHLALASGDPANPFAIANGSDRALRFAGKSSVTIPAGADAVSDPVALNVPTLATMAVSLYLKDSGEMSDVHPLQQGATTRSVRGDATAATSLKANVPGGDPFADHHDDHLAVLSDIEVMAPTATRGLIAIGDSITDGFGASTPAHPWPAALAGLAATKRAGTVAVANAGISADELLIDQLGRPDAGMAGLKRYLRDVIDRPGVTDVLVLFGSNDINRGIDAAGNTGGASARDLIAGYRMLADVAHQHHLRIYIATVPPFAGLADWYTPRREATRLAVNRWITGTKSIDGAIDFSATVAGGYDAPPLALAQTQRPVGMAKACASDAGLHPNDRGYAAMGAAAYNVVFGANERPAQPCQ